MCYIISQRVKYFSDIDDDELGLIRNSFTLPVEKVPDSLQE